MNITHNILVFLIAIATIVLTTGNSVIAQRKFIGSREFSAGLYGKSEGVPWNERVRRVETVRETLDNGTVVKTVTTISEIVPKEGSRQYEKTVENGKTTENESILIDYMLYTRKDRGIWTKVDLRNSSVGATGADAAGNYACAQHSVESAFLNGMTVSLFEKFMVVTGDKGLDFFESRHWVGPDGVFYRGEEVQGKLNPRVETSRTVSVYDYTPNIKIEAPIK